jgi:hypothetical protein
VALPRLGKSSASVYPARGNDIIPTEGIAPKRLSTPRKEPSPLAAMRAMRLASAARPASPSGTTHWYWKKPRGP